MKTKRPTFNIILFTSKKLTDGTSPIVIRVTYNRERRYYSIGRAVHPDNWDKENSMVIPAPPVKRLKDEQKQINIELATEAKKLEEQQKYFEDTEFTFDRYERKYRQTTSGVKVFPYFDQAIEELKKDNKLSSAETYKNCLSRLKAFRPKGVTWHDLDLKFLQQFERFMRPNTTATIGIYMRVLRVLFNKAIDDGLAKADAYPFRTYTIKTETSRKRALTKDQLTILKAYKAKPMSREWHSLNMFMFSYYARGMNFLDIVLLKWGNIRNGRLYYRRSKTGDDIDLGIDGNVASILANYAGTDYIFPLLEDDLPPTKIRQRCKSRLKKCNEDLQAIATSIGLPDDITFYWGRHSYATTLKRAGVGISIIQETLGHSSEAVTRVYLDSFDTDQLDEISKHL